MARQAPIGPIKLGVPAILPHKVYTLTTKKMARSVEATKNSRRSASQTMRDASPLDDDTRRLVAELLLADIEAHEASRRITRSQSTTRLSSSLRELLLPRFIQTRSSSSRKEAEPKPTNSDRSMALLRALGLLAEGELDDHRAALAIERGEPLPPPTAAQLTLESSSFADLLPVPSSVSASHATTPEPQPGPSGSSSSTLEKASSSQKARSDR
ncbi:hypothetical protein BU15DRAFT_73009 [Melanogaster broomeanus]|nr:hypothetical protein BU15DRAFT_73009 [Melanogaster broomeanus]